MVLMRQMQLQTTTAALVTTETMMEVYNIVRGQEAYARIRVCWMVRNEAGKIMVVLPAPPMIMVRSHMVTLQSA